MLRKGYVSREVPTKNPERNNMDYFFDSDPAKAMFWDTKVGAEAACTIFNGRSIMIPSAEGGEYRCVNFSVEERKAAEFVVFCEAPFILRPDHSASTKH